MSCVVGKEEWAQDSLLKAGNPRQHRPAPDPAGLGVRQGGHRALAIQMCSQRSAMEMVRLIAKGPDGPH